MLSANLAWNIVNFRSNLIHDLQAQGYHVVVVAPFEADNVAKLEAMGCEFHAIAIDSKGLSPVRDAQTFWRYCALMKQLRPLAYLGWTIKPNIYGGLAARIAGIPSILNISGLGTAFIRENLLTRIVSALYKAGLGAARTVFFQNGDDEALFLGKGLVRAGQARRISGSGINLERFAGDTGMRPHRGRFLMIARLLGDKGVREYVAAARIMKARDASLTFHLLGFLDVANRTAISRSEVEQWVSEGIIVYHPPVDDVRPYIADSDCVVLPSYREGTSRVLLEAAAMARPVVTSDVPGCREVVDDSVNGYLCRVRDAQSLAEAMAKVAALDDLQWRDMGQAGRDKVVCEFSDAAVVATYRAALDDALELSA